MASPRKSARAPPPHAIDTLEKQPRKITLFQSPYYPRTRAHYLLTDHPAAGERERVRKSAFFYVQAPARRKRKQLYPPSACSSIILTNISPAGQSVRLERRTPLKTRRRASANSARWVLHESNVAWRYIASAPAYVVEHEYQRMEMVS